MSTPRESTYISLIQMSVSGLVSYSCSRTLTEIGVGNFYATRQALLAQGFMDHGHT